MTQFNMIESPQGPDPKRLLLAVIATSAVLMAYSYFFPPSIQVPVAEKAPIPQEIIKGVLAEPSMVLIPSTNIFADATRGDLPEQNKDFIVKEQSKSRQRSSYRVRVSSHGGMISEYNLLDFSHELSLVSLSNTGSSLLRLRSNSAAVSLADNAPYEITKLEEHKISLRHITKEGLSIERSYHFLSDSSIEEKITWRNLSATPLKGEFLLSALKKSDNKTEPGIMNPGVQGEAIIIKTKDKHEKLAFSDLLNKPKTFNNFSYAAFDEQFFLLAISPHAEDSDRIEAHAIDKGNNAREERIEILLKPFVLMQNEEKSIAHKIFMGPKQVDLLASLKPPLDENIDFGWFGVLSRPMLWLLVLLFNFVHNYGIAIILITFIIKLLTYPLTHKSFSSQQSMKELQPKIKELQNKFSHDKTLLGQKQMELYKAHGVNPLAGCLPLLIQLPIWFAFFQMLRSSVELFDQPFFLWITDLTRADQYYVLPVLMGASMLVQQIFTPTPTDQPQMKYVMWAMPIFLTFIMLNMPSGLSLYILTNNLLTIVQQIIIKKHVAKVSA